MSDKKMHEREFRESRSHETYGDSEKKENTSGNIDKDYFSLGTDLLYDLKNVARDRSERIMEKVTTDDILDFLGVNYNY